MRMDERRLIARGSVVVAFVHLEGIALDGREAVGSGTQSIFTLSVNLQLIKDGNP